jgi:hypothetical protein
MSVVVISKGWGVQAAEIAPQTEDMKPGDEILYVHNIILSNQN